MPGVQWVRPPARTAPAGEEVRLRYVPRARALARLDGTDRRSLPGPLARAAGAVPAPAALTRPPVDQVAPPRPAPARFFSARAASTTVPQDVVLPVGQAHRLVVPVGVARPAPPATSGRRSARTAPRGGGRRRRWPRAPRGRRAVRACRPAAPGDRARRGHDAGREPEPEHRPRPEGSSRCHALTLGPARGDRARGGGGPARAAGARRQSAVAPALHVGRVHVPQQAGQPGGAHPLARPRR